VIRQRTHPAATMSASRLEGFTDGVFAIAATLLVLDLTTATFGKVSSDAQLWSALAGEWGLFLNFALSFALLCLLWMTHVSQFEHIVHVDNTMIWLNNGRLLFIVLVPFSTGLVTEYSAYYAGRIILPATFFFAILFGYLQWLWAVRNKDSMIPDMPDKDAAAYTRGSLSALIIAAIVVTVSPWLGSMAFLLWLLDGPLTRILRGKGA
jgi:uncharacterized membrane protein